jgi:hypothetical protein
MSAPYQCAGLFWCTFLPNASQRHTVARALNQNQYHDRRDDRTLRLNDSCRPMRSWNAALPVFTVGAGMRNASSATPAHHRGVTVYAPALCRCVVIESA